MRFTMKGDSLYAFIMVWPQNKSTVIKSLAANSPQIGERKVADVSLLGHGGKIEWTQDEKGLKVKLPDQPPCASAVTLKIKGVLSA
jgi:alpha-L-fucosidase